MMMKLWSNNGRRAAKRKASNKVFGWLSAGKRSTRKTVKKKAPATASNDRIIDFETLLSWYNENNSPVAVGDELSLAHIYAGKQKKLKFL